MSKTRFAVMTAAVLGFVFAWSTSMAASIVGTDHDLRVRFPTGVQEVCVYCHAPHNALSNLLPLWNHATTTQTFTLYTSSTMNGTASQPAGVSKACLSCHDGTVNLDAFGGSAGNAANKMTGGANFGTDLSNDHPIGFLYNSTLVTADANGGANQLVVPASPSSVVAGIPLFAQSLECASCHNAHDNANQKFLRFSNTGSALCLKCHVK